MQTLLERLRCHNFDQRFSRRNLSYFYAAATLGNFTLAAKACGVAQPSLSRGITLLESAIDTALFERSGRSIRLTIKGKQLLPEVELYLNNSLDFVEKFTSQQLGMITKIKIGSVSSLTANLLPELINKFEATNKGITVTIEDGINREIIDAVNAGDVDLGIITTLEDPSRFHTKQLFCDQYCLAVNHNHLFYERETVRWEEIEQENIVTFGKESNIYNTIAQAFNAAGLFFTPAASVRFRHTLMGMVQHRGMSTILPKLAIQESSNDLCRAIPLIEPTIKRSYYLVYRVGRLKKVEANAFGDFLQFELRADK